MSEVVMVFTPSKVIIQEGLPFDLAAFISSSSVLLFVCSSS